MKMCPVLQVVVGAAIVAMAFSLFHSFTARTPAQNTSKPQSAAPQVDTRPALDRWLTAPGSSAFLIIWNLKGDQRQFPASADMAGWIVPSASCAYDQLPDGLKLGHGGHAAILRDNRLFLAQRAYDEDRRIHMSGLEEVPHPQGQDEGMLLAEYYKANNVHP